MVTLRRRDGAFTQELVRAPGSLGLGQVPLRKQPDAVTSMVCGFCSVGCSLDVHLREGQAVNVVPTTAYPVNLGMACPKGWEALTPLGAPDRATTPLLRDSGGELVPVAWPQALASFTERFKGILAAHGPESVAFLSTGQIPTEEMALLGAFAKFGMGLVHGDGNTRQCMATSVAAYKQSFGFDAPPYSYADLEESDVIVLAGSNLCIAHPILWERINRNRHGPEIVVIDPRSTETAVAATQHLAIRPKSDLTLFYGIAHLLVARGWVDERFIAEHTSGFDDFAAHVSAFKPARVAEATGLSVVQLERFAEAIHAGERVSFWWTMGVNQSHEGTRTAQAIIALALLTGSIGRPGTGANSITGQCNAMGSRLFSNTTNLLGGHDFADPDHRAKVAGVLGIDEGLIPDRASDAYDQILEGVVAGRVRGLWIVATNSAHSWIDQGHLEEVLDRLDFLVVQDMYDTTETARLADLVLPAAGWGEKEGTFINSERRVGLVKKVATPPGQAITDFGIVKLLAESWGVGDRFARWSSPEAVFAILQELSAGQPCDLTGVEGYEMIDTAGGVQWPYPAGSAPLEPGAERRLFEDGRFFTPDGRARLLFDEPRAPRAIVSDAHPLVLLTGRGSSSQWHTGTRTEKSPLLRSLAPSSPYVELAPEDAAARGIGPGDDVVVVSARGSMRGLAFVTATVAAGQVFVPMHFARANQLTAAEFDPHSRQPSYKWAVVDVRHPAPWDLVVGLPAAGARPHRHRRR
ncbi:MAG: molybdopterin-dependent oxidoreductase [Acidimicrobiales bacterium]